MPKDKTLKTNSIYYRFLKLLALAFVTAALFFLLLNQGGEKLLDYYFTKTNYMERVTTGGIFYDIGADIVKDPGYVFRIGTDLPILPGQGWTDLKAFLLQTDAQLGKGVVENGTKWFLPESRGTGGLVQKGVFQDTVGHIFNLMCLLIYFQNPFLHLLSVCIDLIF